VFVFHGGIAGLATTPRTTIAAPTGGPAYFGRSITGAGDVNGDGFADLIVGGPGNFTGQSTYPGHVYLYTGGATGVSNVPRADVTGDTLATFMVFGTAVSAAGDLDGDGYPDVLVGAHNASSSTGVPGEAYAYAGGATGLTLIGRLDSSGGTAPMHGFAVAGLGDVNGDGFVDVAVGAPGAGSYAERVEFYAGRTSGPASVPTTTLNAPDTGGFGATLASVADAAPIDRRARAAPACARRASSLPSES
jgi:hypothetical protein